jgi:hypothetical protein
MLFEVRVRSRDAKRIGWVFAAFGCGCHNAEKGIRIQGVPEFAELAQALLGNMAGNSWT